MIFFHCWTPFDPVVKIIFCPCLSIYYIFCNNELKTSLSLTVSFCIYSLTICLQRLTSGHHFLAHHPLTNHSILRIKHRGEQLNYRSNKILITYDKTKNELRSIYFQYCQQLFLRCENIFKLENYIRVMSHLLICV